MGLSAQQNPELAQAATQAFMVLVNGVKLVSRKGNSSGRLRTISVGSLGIDAWVGNVVNGSNSITTSQPVAFV